MYFLGIFQNIGDIIEQSFRSFMGLISATIYTLIENMYLLFNYLAKAEILNNDFIAEIYRKVGLILGLFMVFKLSFSLIQALINPEKLTDKKNGFSSIIVRCVISIVLLGITPSLFREAFKIQGFIVGSDNSNNLIYKLIVGKQVSGDFTTMGRVISSNIYFTFFTDEDKNLNNGVNDTVYNAENNNYDTYSRFRVDNYDNLVSDVENQNMSFYDTLQYLTLKEKGKYVIEFNWLLSVGFGIVFLYLMVSYCLQAATRVIQLAYLQLIAPIPILSYISDPDGTFKNWVKQCTTTFLDLFIRLAIIYFIMSIIDDVITQFNSASGIIFNSTGVASDDATYKALLKIFIILGLLMFAKRAPDLLKDLFPNLSGGAASLGFGLKKPKDMIGDIPLIGGATNKVLGYAGGLGKRFGKFAWNHTGAAAGRAVWNRTGGKINKAYDRWKENRKNAAEIKELEKPGEHLYNKYGDGAAAFKNEGFRNSYLALKAAKDENRKAENDYEIAKASGDAEAIKRAVERKNTAAKALSDAQKTHDNMRKRYGTDARREDQISMYKSMHPTGTRPSGGNNNGNQQNVNQQNVNQQNDDYVRKATKVTAEESVFATMSDDEWKARKKQNKQEIKEENRRVKQASQSDPNVFFDQLDQGYADEYVRNGNVSDEFENNYNTTRSQMEDAYKKAGWEQGSDGKWSKPQ